ncbi:hypothetical protein E1B28_007472 [Marasmius oreades]|uniref:Programmed cell death protein 2 C-terminal domain-containing protein n=1 Tax=Marasmius oreades TaxID=181124 RepID=A0A9P7S293_9AGAR|nr:uncharacterized protein E1B28_007472 [Marasmius oreades]KAG7093833.1 hypothetical protein E1B28_007472 [Marasmius oreades]
MPSATEKDWSDSDDDIPSDVETSVSLGLPDGALQEESDLYDAAVSRIGGRPAFLQSVEPPLSCSQCENCSSLMELLLQIYCPFEDSPMDRALYVWGCSKSGCQGASGSVRAWRGLRHNEEYAKKLENKLARKRERETKVKATSEATRSEGGTANPFSVKTPPDAAAPFTFGTQIFGDPPAQEEEVNGQPGDESDHESISSEESLVTAMATTTLDESPWRSVPSYPAIYLSTSAEYIPAESTPKMVPKLSDGNEKDDVGTWGSEAYENSLNMDQVFDRFSKRVGYEGEQCIRYELNGVPLPFASDSVFEQLFPLPPENPLPVTKGEFKVVLNRKRMYAPAIMECPDCKGKRVFECQLMPNLINVLRPKEDRESKKMTEEERRKHVQMVLKGEGEFGMSWGTCLIFSCKNDCCEGKEGWKEEPVLVQWDK